jgi:hypothetical protein
MTKTVLSEQVLPAIHQHHVGCHVIRDTTNLYSVMKSPSGISYGHLHGSCTKCSSYIRKGNSYIAPLAIPCARIN